MWRCHCGEINLNRATHCRDCAGPRRTHEDRDYEPQPRARQKNVYIGFFGMGMGDERGRDAEPRIMTDQELDAHFNRSRITLRVQWLIFAIAAALGAGVLVWQVLRRE